MFILRFQIQNRPQEKLDLLEIGEAMCQICTMLKASKSLLLLKKNTNIEEKKFPMQQARPDMLLQ